jgi:Secretion system C-terminal sorting domain
VNAAIDVAHKIIAALVHYDHFMKKTILFLLVLQMIASVLTAQKIFHARVDKTDVALRGAPAVLGQITMNAPSAGKVVVRFDGDCTSAAGDRIVLAASNTTNLGGNDSSVVVKRIPAYLSSCLFSHTRVYNVPAGTHTFYALGQNLEEMGGNGIATVYGSLTVEWFSETPGEAFVRHKGIAKTNFNVEGAPVILAEQQISVPAAGTVVVRFDGYSVSTDGDLLFFAASNTPNWGAYDASASMEIATIDYNKNLFVHVRSYPVAPGTHTYYAVIENYYEIYGNGIASVFGSLTVEYYPAAAPVKTAFQGISQLGVNIRDNPFTMGTATLDAPVSGKVLVNFTGTCIASFGDFIKIAASDTPNWGSTDWGLGFKPFNSDRNRTPFSHTRMYDVGPGQHTFYGVAQNVQQFLGSGLAVVYGSLTATFFPNEALATAVPNSVFQFSVTPNPAADFISLNLENADSKVVAWELLDEMGVVLKQSKGQIHQSAEPIRIALSDIPSGVYFIRLYQKEGFSTKSFVRI